ncbi:MAG: uroporphyrinogen-III synthase [Methanomicrobiales archaeon]|nr:uroporphyrinogen-III synthase [Methanomicrobiales archaeon]
MKIAITRLKEKAGRDRALCAEYGHECVSVSPLHAEVYGERVASFAASVNRGAFDAVFFTSALPARLIGPLLVRWPRVIAIGPQTAATLSGFGIDCETLPSYYSRDFAPYLGDWLSGRTVGIPRADVPNPGLLDAIREKNGTPVEVSVYGLQPTREPLVMGDAGAILFTSARSFSDAVWECTPRILRIAIGDVTAAAMAAGGCPPDVVGDGSLAGTLSALNRHLAAAEGVRQG